jgi:hypothetical protein
MGDFQRSYYMPTGEKYADITVKDGVASISEELLHLVFIGHGLIEQ